MIKNFKITIFLVLANITVAWVTSGLLLERSSNDEVKGVATQLVNLLSDPAWVKRDIPVLMLFNQCGPIELPEPLDGIKVAEGTCVQYLIDFNFWGYYDISLVSVIDRGSGFITKYYAVGDKTSVVSGVAAGVL